MFPIASATLILAAASGCGPEEEIAVVTSDRTEPPRQEFDAEAARRQLDHMFAAIVPHGEKAWFFKLVAPASTAEKAGAEFDAFISTVSLDDVSASAKVPNWELPEGWSSEPAGGMRDATITMPVGESRLELTVSSLPLRDDWTTFLTANVNRWLNQLSQSPLDADTIESLVESQSIKGGEATTVELVGEFTQPSMGGQMPAGHPPVAQSSEQQRPTNRPAANQPTSDELTFDVPEAWTDGRPSAMRKASFAADGGVDISVTAFPNQAQMGDLGFNLQRWASQVGLVSESEEALIDLAEQIDVGGLDGHFVNLKGDGRSTLAAMVPRDDRVWFFKFTGPTDAVQAQRDAFRSFLDSVEFTQP